MICARPKIKHLFGDQLIGGLLTDVFMFVSYLQTYLVVLHHLYTFFLMLVTSIITTAWPNKQKVTTLTYLIVYGAFWLSVFISLLLSLTIDIYYNRAI